MDPRARALHALRLRISGRTKSSSRFARSRIHEFSRRGALFKNEKYSVLPSSRPRCVSHLARRVEASPCVDTAMAFSSQKSQSTGPLRVPPSPGARGLSSSCIIGKHRTSSRAGRVAAILGHHSWPVIAATLAKYLISLSGRVDSNHRPPDPQSGQVIPGHRWPANSPRNSGLTRTA